MQLFTSSEINTFDILIELSEKILSLLPHVN